ncbi:uncharacterized protein K460DRAFT_372213 [Cucurbitaria berberidis CBS 394.84]|uniref:AMP-binding enzyme C-terminal domain-containing protein n=1 Tax=Cucurbitaria berberidis CBS 394.84 TaxID=1168544 RepID=A0A9P4GR35_9PLEO|nr:uncharacterized protein K460DRAFT_372213 [Cucurbitaria berberidis CBS 394.84]KAF1849790.1 hypothetical protein K460DRAFT_372213 [Cucurbitaria berberidis CBS 394.84]
MLMQKKIVQRYRATGFIAIFKVHLEDKKAPDRPVTEIASGIDVRLFVGDRGEVLVKSPRLLYIAEVMAGVDDNGLEQRMAALILLQDEDLTDTFLKTYCNTEYILTIDDLRRDLRNRLAGYKLPTALRVVSGELPKTATRKVQKKLLGPYSPRRTFMLGPEEQRVIPPRPLAKW